MTLPPSILSDSAARLADSGLTVTVRPMDRNPRSGERSYVFEAAAKTRWPRDLGFSWREWVSIYGPRVGDVIESGSAVVVDATPPGTSHGSVLLGFALADKHGRLLCVHVKPDFRGHGLGVQMLVALGMPTPVPVVAVNQSWEKWCRGRGINWYVDAAQVAA